MRDGSIVLEHLVAAVASPAAIEESIQMEWQSELFALACRAVQPQFQPATWTAFWKTAVEGHAAASVAQELGMNLGSVYVARSRVLAKIKNWVQASSQRWESEE
jgi:RNA polymerase sigma-70 factor (ECF subfamily)